eukprot:1158032-Pelagomonas_calceolata.AAC.2
MPAAAVAYCRLALLHACVCMCVLQQLTRKPANALPHAFPHSFRSPIARAPPQQLQMLSGRDIAGKQRGQ